MAKRVDGIARRCTTGAMRPTTTLTIFASVLGACGGSEATPDARIVIADAPLDSSPDSALPDAPSYDFSCAGTTAPTSAPAMISINGMTQQLGMSGPQPLADVTVDLFAVGTPTALSHVTSDANGAFSASVPSGGAPLNAYLRGSAPMYRTTLTFPDAPFTAAQVSVPVLMVSQQIFDLLTTQVADVDQDDANNGAMFITIVDCAGTPIDGANLSVAKSGAQVGEQFDLGKLAPQAAGSFFVFNVPDGEVEISAELGTHTLRSHRVTSRKGEAAPGGGAATGTITTTVVRPGF